MVRVLVKTLLLRRDAGGGSTITQQLAKNLYPRQSYGRLGLAADKVREIIIARRLERAYTKEEILELYINTVSFGEETFGLKTASIRFFNTSPSELSLEQAATLAGVLRATTYYNPRLYPERSRHRRNIVIRQMERYQMISSEEADNVVNLPLSLEYNRTTENDGLAPHFREHLRLELTTLLQNLPALDGKEYNLYTDGLVIRTTLDSRMQRAAESAVQNHLHKLQIIYNKQPAHFAYNDPVIRRIWKNSPHYKNLKRKRFSEEKIDSIFHTPLSMYVFSSEGEQEMELSPHDSILHYLTFINAGFFALEPANGKVRVWTGSISHRYFPYDHVKARRQPGSAFKPVVYAAAIENGSKPCDYHRNLLTIYEDYDEWMPQNPDREEYGGYYSMQAALAKSINTIAVSTLMEAGIEEVALMGKKMGIRSDIPSNPSIALGTAELSLMELTSAYTSFANRGIPAIPYYLEAIYNSEGELIYNFNNPNTAEYRSPAMKEETAATMVHMLAKAVDKGTGRALRSNFGIDHAIAGKTGTTQNNTDGWFIGMTPDLVFGAWAGGRETRVRLQGSFGSGSQTALPICGIFLKNIQKNNDLPTTPRTFHDHQKTDTYSTSCDDYREETFTDVARDFLRGVRSDQPRRVREDDQDKSIRNRIRKWLGRD